MQKEKDCNYSTKQRDKGVPEPAFLEKKAENLKEDRVIVTDKK